MGDTFAILALRRKRAHLAGEIAQAERALAKQRHTLATIDAVINMFEPATNPDLIPPIRPVSRRCMFFRHGEMTRLCVSALREADKPVQARWITEYAIAAKGLESDRHFREKLTEQFRAALKRLVAKGLVRQIVQWPDTWWELAIDD